MKIDVVLANYNHGTSITQAIQALNNQTLRPNRIYVIDDASTDNSWATILEASEYHENLVLTRNLTNQGANYCFNMGLEFCTSELVYFAASDDVTYRELFEKTHEKLVANPQAAFASAETLVYDLDKNRSSIRPIIRPKIIGKFMNPVDIEKEFKKNDHWIMTGACVYRTEFVKNVSGLNPKLGAFSDSFMAKQLAFKYGGIYLKYTGARWNISKHGYSRSMYKSYEEWDNLEKDIHSFIVNNLEFPNWYLAKFANRLAFNRIRLSSQDYETWFKRSSEFFPRLSIITKQNSIFRNKRFRFMFLLVAFIEYQPYSIFRIIQTYLMRWVGKTFKNYSSP